MNKTNVIINLCDRWFDDFRKLQDENDKILIGSYTCGNYFKWLSESMGMKI